MTLLRNEGPTQPSDRAEICGMMITMARCDADYKSEVLLTCYDALSRRGFTRYRKADVDWPFDNDFHGWVGLNTGLYAEYVEVNPFMGIHATSIHRLCARIRKTKPSENAKMTEAGTPSLAFCS